MSPAYATVGLLVSQRLGRVELYVNGENLTDFRQTRYEPLVLPFRADDLGWQTIAQQWAPVAGRVVNAGVRLRF